MILEYFASATSNITLILLVIALGIFARLAIQSRGTKNFQFHMSLFIMIWIVGELVGVLAKNEILNISVYESVGHQIHLASMAAISVIFWLRFYYSNKSGKKFIDEIPA